MTIEELLDGEFTVAIGPKGEMHNYRARRKIGEENAILILTDDNIYLGVYYTDTYEFVPRLRYKERPKFTWPASLRAVCYVLNRLGDLMPEITVRCT